MVIAHFGTVVVAVVFARLLLLRLVVAQRVALLDHGRWRFGFWRGQIAWNVYCSSAVDGLFLGVALARLEGGRMNNIVLRELRGTHVRLGRRLLGALEDELIVLDHLDRRLNHVPVVFLLFQLNDRLLRRRFWHFSNWRAARRREALIM